MQTRSKTAHISKASQKLDGEDIDCTSKNKNHKIKFVSACTSQKSTADKSVHNNHIKTQQSKYKTTSDIDSRQNKYKQTRDLRLPNQLLGTRTSTNSDCEDPDYEPSESSESSDSNYSDTY